MSGGDKSRCVIAHDKARFGPLLRNLDKTFDETGVTLYQARNVLKRLIWGEQQVIVKSFGVPNAVNRLLYRWVRKSKARRAFENAVELSKRGITTPSPIGYIEYDVGLGLARSFYAYDEWRADFTLRECITNPDYSDRIEILAALGAFTWQMHHQGVNFLDFSPGNILVQWEAKKAFCLVDINRIRFQSLMLEERMRTFARLWANDEDLETIVAGYALASGDNVALATALAIRYSQAHKRRSWRKEQIKTWLNLN
jgi:tRNA A-37 threonylcarbamoyl transferase component Bud32